MGYHKNRFKHEDEHEETHVNVAVLDEPKAYMVEVELFDQDGTDDDEEPDVLGLTVPASAINFITYVLGLNHLVYRVVPITD